MHPIIPATFTEKSPIDILTEAADFAPEKFFENDTGNVISWFCTENERRGYHPCKFESHC
jgi:hypothetical protein